MSALLSTELLRRVDKHRSLWLAKTPMSLFHSFSNSVLGTYFWIFVTNFQISVSQILRRHDLYSTLVEEANAIISAIARNVDVPFLRPNVAPDPMLWSDLVHLSDAGLAQWLEYLDILVVVILGKTIFFYSEFVMKWKCYLSPNSSNQADFREYFH